MPAVTPAASDDKVLFCSFHTNDDYYTEAGNTLRRSLDRLNLPHEIAEVEKKPGEEWLEICRKKIPFLHGICEAYPDHKIFWMDVDCDIDYLPDFIADFSADIIGFQRGFSSPLRIGNSARFWEPCFWGINTSPEARGYIRDANEASATMTLRATDDYFFEESWRKNAGHLTFQLIPSTMIIGKSETVSQRRRPFFYFGSSGNVATFKGLAAQHTRAKPPAAAGKAGTGAPMPTSAALRVARKMQEALPESVATRLRQMSDRIGFTEYLSPTLPAKTSLPGTSIYNLIHDARAGKADEMRAQVVEITSRRILRDSDQAVITTAEAFLDVIGPDPATALPLFWWDKPFPGNFGDWLSPLVVNAFTGRGVRYQRHDEKAAGPHLVAVGSIGKFAQKSSILVGTGISRSDAELVANATYMSLRGPYSAEALMAAGGPRVERFGDPAVLLPRLFPMERPQATNGRLALVRHFAHRPVALRLPEGVDEYSVLRSRRDDLVGLIGSLMAHDGVITSAMHVYIICQSYGIPVALVTFAGFENAVHGDQIKYRDYAAGVGVPERLPIGLAHDLRDQALRDLLTDDHVPAAAMDSVAEALTEAVAILDSRRRA
jgi:hypothetical protein